MKDRTESDRVIHAVKHLSGLFSKWEKEQGIAALDILKLEFINRFNKTFDRIDLCCYELIQKDSKKLRSKRYRPYRLIRNGLRK